MSQQLSKEDQDILNVWLKECPNMTEEYGKELLGLEREIPFKQVIGKNKPILCHESDEDDDL